MVWTGYTSNTPTRRTCRVCTATVRGRESRSQSARGSTARIICRRSCAVDPKYRRGQS